MNIRHVLLPSDLSEEALRPCEPAAELARVLGARLTLLSVVQDLRTFPQTAPEGGPVPPPPDPLLDLDQARGALERLTPCLGEGVDVHVDAVLGTSVHEAIVQYADEHAVDLIAMSTHGRTGFRRLALGSIAEAVLRHAHVPVLCFPRQR